MIRKLFCFAVAACTGMVLFSPPAFSSDYGCKVLLCLMNPGGATEFQECEPTIRRFKRDMYLGRPFPSCDMGGSSDSVGVDHGKQIFKPCAEAYGAGFEPYRPPHDADSESDGSEEYDLFHSDRADNYEDGHAYNSRTVCRQYLGTRPVLHCVAREGDRDDTCHYVDEPYYATRPVLLNDGDHYVQTSLNGETQGQKFHYSRR